MGTHLEDKHIPRIVIGCEIYRVEKFYISDLGYLMMRLYSEDRKVYTTHNLGTHNPEENIFKDAIEKR